LQAAQKRGTVTLIAGYTILSLIFWAGRPAEVNFDSYRYLGELGWNFQAIFEPLNGGFATSLLYVIVPDPTAISLTQILISVLAWSFLAVAIVRRLAGTWVAWVLSALTLLISFQSIFWSQHFAIASESLVFSAVVFWLAAIVFLAGSSAPGSASLAAITLGILAIAITRPQAMLVLIPVQIVVLLWWSRREQSFSSLKYTLPALLPIAAFALFRVYQVSQHDRWPFRYALHNLVDKSPSFRQYALERMPPCEPINAALDGPQPWNDVLAFDGTMISLCPDTYLWFKSDAISVFNWVPEIPGAAIANFIAVLPGLTLLRWTDAMPLPALIDQLLMLNLNPWWFLLACLFIGVILAAAAGVRPRITPLGIAGLLVTSASVVGYVFAVWAADGVDFGRHVYPILPFIGLALFIMPAVLPQRLTSQRSVEEGISP